MGEVLDTSYSNIAYSWLGWGLRHVVNIKCNIVFIIVPKNNVASIICHMLKATYVEMNGLYAP